MATQEGIIHSGQEEISLPLSERTKLIVYYKDYGLKLTLYTRPFFNYLSVFIQDPKKSHQYWFRKIHIDPTMIVGPRTDCYFRIASSKAAHDIPFLEENLDNAVRAMESLERRNTTNINTCYMQGTVGVAEFMGQNGYTLEHLLPTIAMHYSTLLRSSRLGKNF